MEPAFRPWGHCSENRIAGIVDDLVVKNWSFIPGFVDNKIWVPLFNRARLIESYTPAGIGRGVDRRHNGFVRSDSIQWLTPGHPADDVWLELMEKLRLAVNREFFLGLFEFESHFAFYPPGSFYRRHLDAFQGEGNRVVSTVLYLNPVWQPDDGGELVLYPHDNPGGKRFLPRGGDLTVFMSEYMPHEVRAASRARYSLAGWFRVNGSTGDRVNPPR